MLTKKMINERVEESITIVYCSIIIGCSKHIALCPTNLILVDNNPDKKNTHSSRWCRYSPNLSV